MRRIAHISLLGAIALFGMVACSDEKSSDTTVADSVTGEGGDDTTVDTTEDIPDDTVDPTIEGAGVGTPFCDANTALNENDLPLETATPAEVQAYYEDVLPDMLDQLVEATPPELEADVTVLIDGVIEFGEVLENNEWSVEAAFADPAMSELIGSEDFNIAGARVDAYCAEA